MQCICKGWRATYRRQPNQRLEPPVPKPDAMPTATVRTSTRNSLSPSGSFTSLPTQNRMRLHASHKPTNPVEQTNLLCLDAQCFPALAPYTPQDSACHSKRTAYSCMRCSSSSCCCRAAASYAAALGASCSCSSSASEASNPRFCHR